MKQILAATLILIASVPALAGSTAPSPLIDPVDQELKDCIADQPPASAKVQDAVDGVGVRSEAELERRERVARLPGMSGDVHVAAQRPIARGWLRRLTAALLD
jgi:hypothetical protein